MIYELIGRLTVWFVKRRTLERVAAPSILTVIGVGVAAVLVAFLGVGLFLGSATEDDDSV